jgi:hypothetical protein
MSTRTYCTVTAIVFLLIGLAHVVRVAVGFPFRIGSWDLPRAVSAVGAVVTLYLAWSGFALARKSSAPA